MKDTAATAGLPPPAIQPRGVCAPTAAELAKEAGLSPAELQVLQNLGARRGQLDQREEDLSTQLALLAAAEAKVDAKVRALTGLKSDIKGLLTAVAQLGFQEFGDALDAADKRGGKNVAAADQQDQFGLRPDADEAGDHPALRRTERREAGLRSVERREILRELAMEERGSIGALDPDDTEMGKGGDAIEDNGVHR